MDFPSKILGNEHRIPMPSLRLLHSPLRLLSACMSNIAKFQRVSYYSKMEEFVNLVTDVVPNVLSASDRAELTLRLRIKSTLELKRLRSENPESVQHHLDMDALAKASESEDVYQLLTEFRVTLQALEESRVEGERHFKSLCASERWAHNDRVIQLLICIFLNKVDRLFQTPSLQQTASWVGSSWFEVDICLQPLDNPEALRRLFQLYNQVSKKSSPNTQDCPPLSTCQDTAFSDHSLYTQTLAHGDSSNSCPDIVEARNSLTFPGDFADSDSDNEDGSDHAANTDYDEDNGSLCSVQGIYDEGLAQVTNDPDAVINEGCQTVVEDVVCNSVCLEETSHVEKATTSIRQGDKVKESKTLSEGEKVLPVNPVKPMQPSKLCSPTPVDSLPLLTRQPHKTETGTHEVKSRARPVNVVEWVSQIVGGGISLPALPPLPEGSISTQFEPPRKRRPRASKQVSSQTTEGQEPCVSPISPCVAAAPRRKPKVIAREGTVKMMHVCLECGKVFRWKSLLERHERRHRRQKVGPDASEKQKVYQCPECKEVFTSSKSLNSHMTTHPDFLPFKCDVCGKSFQRKSYLHNHVRTHTGEKPFLCSVCGKGFSQKGYQKIHEACHTDQLLFPCSHCPKRFPSAFKLRMHERYHIGDRPYQCELCGRGFLDAGTLRRHQGYHQGVRNFLCGTCGRTFVYLTDLKKHQREHLKPPERVPCPVCHKLFSGKYCLKYHMRLHSGEKPFECKDCGKRFAQRENLRCHMRKHTGERPFVCHICGKTYKFSSNLRDHLYSHTEERPYKCNSCASAFKTVYLLKVHQKTHTGECRRRKKTLSSRPSAPDK